MLLPTHTYCLHSVRAAVFQIVWFLLLLKMKENATTTTVLQSICQVFVQPNLKWHIPKKLASEWKVLACIVQMYADMNMSAPKTKPPYQKLSILYFCDIRTSIFIEWIYLAIAYATQRHRRISSQKFCDLIKVALELRIIKNLAFVKHPVVGYS